MSYHTEHLRMKPVLDMARKYDIASNSDPLAIFEAGNAGFQIWCTPDDHPKGWEEVASSLTMGAFSKPCGYVAGVGWQWDGDKIVALALQTDAYDLLPKRPTGKHERQIIINRPEDTNWAREKIKWLFKQAGVDLPPIEVINQ